MPQEQGLYRSQFEHDACGVGFVAHLDGKPRHSIVQQGIQILLNLEHRGACGCDALTGDGAGILVQIPDRFFRKSVAGDFDLPPAGHYAVGMVFMPTDFNEANFVQQTVERFITNEGQTVLGWRDLPVVSASIGEQARLREPFIRQVFVGKSADVEAGMAFERRLFIIRKQIENAVRDSTIAGKSTFHIPSMSAATVIYKGLLLANQIPLYFPDLGDEAFESKFALVHQRYSTNTTSTWSLAHPFRYLAHNGEINTLRGNVNWMHARQSLMETPLIDDIERLFPIIADGQSDSACLDNALELLYMGGRSLPHAITMLVPEAWQNHKQMDAAKRAYYEYHSCLMEPWDGPASIAFTDGRFIGALLDRNGLRPARYWVTDEGLVVMASEAGVLDIPQDKVKLKGRLQPGRMFLCDMEEHRIISDEEIKRQLIERQPYGQWLKENLVRLEELPAPRNFRGFAPETLRTRQMLFGYTLEDLRILMVPMAKDGKEPIGSMGNDAALAVMSERPRLLPDYFKQLFAQVTNPPLDAIREELVTSLFTTIGAEGNLFDETPEQCRQILLEQPILTNRELEKLNKAKDERLHSAKLTLHFDLANGAAGLRDAMDDICEKASDLVRSGINILVLTDRDCDEDHAPIPALLAVAGVHHHLIRLGIRTRVGIVLESGEPREVHHFALLLGYGCGAVNPYVAFDSIEQMRLDGMLGNITREQARENYIHAIGTGLLKVMSKMGISTLQSYRGAQIFEAVGLSSEVIDRYFTWTASRIEGVDLETIAAEGMARHAQAFPDRDIPENLELDLGGQYQWRRGGERHMINPFTVAALQESARLDSRELFAEFCRLVDDDARSRCTLRGLVKFKAAKKPIPLDDVEPAKDIVRRFCTGAMSYGSISLEAHQTLAVAMNRIGGKSNTGEGGEDPRRFVKEPNGDSRNSKIKQIASGRFGVTINYLNNAEELQIKMAQGAKPGEGGQLPGEKVYKWIAEVRHSTPYVGLISPPPHHDIYSIEDLAQLIHDLKNSNPTARISVKLVAEIGVGTIAAGVAKGKADLILISGHDGGTGASPLTSIKHAGLPWELGLAETHQTLVTNNLRSRVTVQTDGQLKTPRDVAIACMLGAEEFGFSTAPLIALGCIMMRKCHLNTCPVGIATQDPELRKKFTGQPEHAVNYFFMLAEGIRAVMAGLGIKKMDDLVGRVDLLEFDRAIEHWKTKGLNLAPILHKPAVPKSIKIRKTMEQDHGLAKALDNELIRRCEPAIARGERVAFESPIRNINRTVGTMLSSAIAKKYGAALLPDDTIHIKFKGSAGNSFACFGAKGLFFELEGDSNDYFCKGLSGAKVVVYPAREAKFVAEENIIIGNVAFYGATSGQAYVRGLAGERFCVRNSGAQTVVEGIGDHGCEYMTGGRAVILGPTGRNFAAGMSGGVAYILDEAGTFAELCNMEMVDLGKLEDNELFPNEVADVRRLIENHKQYTGSTIAARVLDNWDALMHKFVKVMPRDYKRALTDLMKEEHAALTAANGAGKEAALAAAK